MCPGGGARRLPNRSASPYKVRHAGRPRRGGRKRLSASSAAACFATHQHTSPAGHGMTADATSVASVQPTARTEVGALRRLSRSARYGPAAAHIGWRTIGKSRVRRRAQSPPPLEERLTGQTDDWRSVLGGGLAPLRRRPLDFGSLRPPPTIRIAPASRLSNASPKFFKEPKRSVRRGGRVGRRRRDGSDDGARRRRRREAERGNVAVTSPVESAKSARRRTRCEGPAPGEPSLRARRPSRPSCQAALVATTPFVSPSASRRGRPGAIAWELSMSPGRRRVPRSARRAAVSGSRTSPPRSRDEGAHTADHSGPGTAVPPRMPAGRTAFPRWPGAGADDALITRRSSRSRRLVAHLCSRPPAVATPRARESAGRGG